MNRAEFSYIAHQTHDYCNPISAIKVERLLDMLDLTAAARVVDFGAGKCELLIRLVERFGVEATAIEPERLFADEARRRSLGRISAERLQVHEQTAEAFLCEHPHARFAAAACVGASHAFGEFSATLDALTDRVDPGGWLIIGEGYWKQPPSREYLEALGGSESELTTHANNVQRAVDKGLIPMWASTASDDDWDDYEWRYSASIEAHASQHPDDPDTPARLERIRRWRTAYLAWGRDTLGFGLYLFRKPS